MATDYISRDSAVETAMDYRVDVIENDYDYGYQKAVEDIAKGLNAVPAADVRHDVKGHWIEEDGTQICSECGDEHSWGEYRASFCECCGAKMRGVDDGSQ